MWYSFGMSKTSEINRMSELVETRRHVIKCDRCETHIVGDGTVKEEWKNLAAKAFAAGWRMFEKMPIVNCPECVFELSKITCKVCSGSGCCRGWNCDDCNGSGKVAPDTYDMV